MRKLPLILLSLSLAALTAPARAQRAKLEFKESVITDGEYKIIAGGVRRDPDIYMEGQRDSSRVAHRLTVKPSSTPVSVGKPYLQCAGPDRMTVCWKTTAAPSTAQVVWGESKESLDHTLDEVTTVQLAGDYCWTRATITGLRPATAYYYKVVNNGKSSAVQRFCTLPPAGSRGKLRCLVIGDHQRNEHSDYEWLMQAAKRKLDEKYGEAPLGDHVSFLLNLGDQVDRGDLSHYEQNHLFKNRLFMGGLPTMTCVGNHELKGDPDVALYEGHYPYGELEYKGISSGTAKWYAYQTGRTLWVVLDSDHATAEQKMWLRRVMATADADPDVDFVVSAQHRPLYAEMWSNDVSAWMRTEIIPILSASPKYVMDCAGHHHLYSRGQLAGVPVYHIISGGGVGTYASGYEQLFGVCLTDNRDCEETEKTVDQSTYQIVEFDSETGVMAVECYAIGNRRLAVDNELVDSFSIAPAAPAEALPAPALSVAPGETTLPLTVRQASPDGAASEAQYQVARDREFRDIVVERRSADTDWYGVGDDLWPENVAEGHDKLTLRAGELKAGTYFIRCRNRDRNLRWGPFGEPAELRVAGQDGAQAASIALDKRFYSPGEEVRVSFLGAPVGTDAWIGVYKKGKNPGKSNPSSAWGYTRTAGGALSLTVTDTGEYYAVLFKDGGYTECSDRAGFFVAEGFSDDKPFAMTTGKTVYEEGEPIDVRVSNAPNMSKDWVGIYAQGVTPQGATCPTYLYTTGRDMSLTLNAPGTANYSAPLPAGTYFVSYFTCDGYTEPFARRSFFIGKAVELMPAKERYGAGEAVILLYEGTAPDAGCALQRRAAGDGAWETCRQISATGGALRVEGLGTGAHEFRIVAGEGSPVSSVVTVSVTGGTAVTAPAAAGGRSDTVYTLDGREVKARAARRGIYVVNGTKVLR